MKNFLFLISLCLVGCGGEVNTKLSTVANQELAKYTFANEIERIKITQRCSSLEFAVDEAKETICIAFDSYPYRKKFSLAWYDVEIEKDETWKVTTSESFYKELSFEQAKNELIGIILETLPSYQTKFDKEKNNIESWSK